MKNLNFVALVLVIFSFVACKKNGTGGENTIAAFPKHHGVAIPNATVYIKYGATELPGVNASDFDDSKVAIKEGTGAAHAHFEGLLKGDYFIYAIGFDSTVSEIVSGGIAVKISSKSGEKDVEVPVTE
jgi:hypothetical protein